MLRAKSEKYDAPLAHRNFGEGNAILYPVFAQQPA